MKRPKGKLARLPQLLCMGEQQWVERDGKTALSPYTACLICRAISPMYHNHGHRAASFTYRCKQFLIPRHLFTIQQLLALANPLKNQPGREVKSRKHSSSTNAPFFSLLSKWREFNPSEASCPWQLGPEAKLGRAAGVSRAGLRCDESLSY